MVFGGQTGHYDLKLQVADHTQDRRLTREQSAQNPWGFLLISRTLNLAWLIRQPIAVPVAPLSRMKVGAGSKC